MLVFMNICLPEKINKLIKKKRKDEVVDIITNWVDGYKDKKNKFYPFSLKYTHNNSVSTAISLDPSKKELYTACKAISSIAEEYDFTANKIIQYILISHFDKNLLVTNADNQDCG